MRGGKRVGELDEEMVYESRVGDTFTLGSTTWRIEDITPDRVLVSPAPGLPGRLPFWKGDAPGGPPSSGRDGRDDARDRRGTRRRPRALDGWGLDDWARDNLLAYLRDQEEAPGELATDGSSSSSGSATSSATGGSSCTRPYGAEVHAPWALALGARLRSGTAWTSRRCTPTTASCCGSRMPTPGPLGAWPTTEGGSGRAGAIDLATCCWTRTLSARGRGGAGWLGPLRGEVP